MHSGFYVPVPFTSEHSHWTNHERTLVSFSGSTIDFPNNSPTIQGVIAPQSRGLVQHGTSKYGEQGGNKKFACQFHLGLCDEHLSVGEIHYLTECIFLKLFSLPKSRSMSKKTKRQTFLHTPPLKMPRNSKNLRKNDTKMHQAWCKFA